MTKVTWVQSALGLLWLSVACSSREGDGGSEAANNGGTTQLSTTIGGAGSGPSATGGEISLGTSTGTPGTGGAGGGTGTMVTCTEGEDCTCPTVSVAVMGKPGEWGDKDTTAFMTWLNSSSAGTAKVDSFPDRVVLTPEFLLPYNVIILLGLGDDSDSGPFWTYDATETAAMQAWVEAGGGLITLNGAGQSDEIKPQNELLAFSGISYNGDGVTPDCTIVDASGNEMCWCTGNPMPIAPSDFVTTDPLVANLASGITSGVGVHIGRSINAPADAHVAAAVSGRDGQALNVLVGKVAGNGRILVFSDEWITYTSQWQSTDTSATCEGFLPQDVYQTAQFWYNMVHWVQPNATCFKIVDEEQEVVLW